MGIINLFNRKHVPPVHVKADESTSILDMVGDLRQAHEKQIRTFVRLHNTTLSADDISYMNQYDRWYSLVKELGSLGEGDERIETLKTLINDARHILDTENDRLGAYHSVASTMHYKFSYMLEDITR